MSTLDRRDGVPDEGDVLERVTDGVTALDTELRYTYVNRRAEEILGRARDELLGNYVWDVFPEVVGTVAQTALEEALATQEEWSYERYNPRLDRWFDVRIFPDEAGLSVLFTDETERKVLERERDRTDRQLAALVENTSEAIYIKDLDGRYQFANRAAAEPFGLAPADLVGTDDRDLFDPASAADIRVADRYVLEYGTSTTQETVRYVDGERHVFLDEKHPYRDEDGDVVGLMGISRDVTALDSQRHELRALNEEYEAIFENAEDAMFLVDVEVAGEDGDVEFHIARLNPAHEATSGMQTDEVRGKTPRDVLGDVAGAAVEASYRRCVEARAPIRYEEELPMPEGRIVWQTSIAPVVVDGAVTRLVGIARDMTGRVERESELRRKNERLDEFASVISHDLRNPLTVALGRTRHVREEYESEHLDAAVRALDRMEAIVGDTLTLARQGETVTEQQPVDVAAEFARCWEMVETGDATLETVDEVHVVGDPARLDHVFENLVRNAVEHVGPAVTVRVGRLDGGFYVEDDGPGIPLEARDSVFDRGYTSTPGGTGFGLAIVERIAEAHGWQVAVTDGTDGGARFEFTGVALAG